MLYGSNHLLDNGQSPLDSILQESLEAHWFAHWMVLFWILCFLLFLLLQLFTLFGHCNLQIHLYFAPMSCGQPGNECTKGKIDNLLNTFHIPRVQTLMHYYQRPRAVWFCMQYDKAVWFLKVDLICKIFSKFFSSTCTFAESRVLFYLLHSRVIHQNIFLLVCAKEAQRL